MALVAAALASPELTRAQLRPALAGAKKVNNPEIIALIEKKLAAMPAEPAAAGGDASIARRCSRTSAAIATRRPAAALTVALNGEQLMATPPGGKPPR